MSNLIIDKNTIKNGSMEERFYSDAYLKMLKTTVMGSKGSAN